MISPITAASAVCTLCEGDYDKGVAALFNSLITSGFRGRFFIGYRGENLPTLQNLLSYAGNCLTDQVEIIPIEANWSGHLTNCKPSFISSIFRDYDDISRVAYFDPDIVVMARWSFFEEWIDHGIALCAGSSNGYMMSDTHPKKMQWERIANDLGLTYRRHYGYANSGFVGVARTHAAFPELWSKLTESLVGANLFDACTFKHHDITHPFATADQDILNMALHLTDIPFSLAGPDSMGLLAGRPYMAHALGPQKPWRRHFIRAAIRHGQRPSFAARTYWSFVRTPVLVFPRWRIGLALLEIKVAAVIARLLS